jgi:hypothetical protein
MSFGLTIHMIGILSKSLFVFILLFYDMSQKYGLQAYGYMACSAYLICEDDVLYLSYNNV